MKNLRHILATIVALFTMSTLPLLSSSRDNGKIRFDNTPVNNFQLERFLGEWYEIARFDHKFERKLEKVKAVYSLREDGTLRVVNTGYKDGVRTIAEGKGKVVNPGSGDGYLKVAFFWIFYADYRILMLDKDYRYALVGSKRDNYLWIMSRTPVMKEVELERVLREARRRGYDLSRLIWVQQ